MMTPGTATGILIQTVTVPSHEQTNPSMTPGRGNVAALPADNSSPISQIERQSSSLESASASDALLNPLQGSVSLNSSGPTILSLTERTAWLRFAQDCSALLNKDLGVIKYSEMVILKQQYYPKVLSRLFDPTINDSDLKSTAKLAEKFFSYLSYKEIKKALEEVLSQQPPSMGLPPVFEKLARINLHLCATLLTIATFPTPSTPGGTSFWSVAACKNFLLDRFPAYRPQIEQFLDNIIDHLTIGSCNTMLHHAVQWGDKNITPIFLVDNPKLIDLPSNGGTTPLMQACWRNDTAMIQTLLANGANIHLADWAGKTALIHAQEVGGNATVQLLIAKGGAKGGTRTTASIRSDSYDNNAMQVVIRKVV